MQFKKMIVTGIISSILVIGAVTVVAQEGNGRGFGGRGFGQSDLIETYTGLSGIELREAVTEGSTLAQLIEANGQSVDAFISDALAEMQAKLDERVADGSIDQATADARLATFEEHFTERINQPFEVNRDNRANRGIRFGQSELVETYTGLSAVELREAVAEGTTLAQLIEANGQSVDAFVSDALAEMQAKLDERVADGSIDQATADARLATFENTLTERINQVIEFDGNRRGRGGRD